MRFEKQKSLADKEKLINQEKMKANFVVKHGIIEANKKKLGNLQAESKEIQQRKLEIQKEMENKKELLMVCVLEDSKAYGKLKYCFVEREGVSNCEILV